MQFPIRSLGRFVTTLAAMLLLAPLAVQAEPVNINTADATLLAKSLNGVGPAKARAIVSYRDKNGPFKSVDQLAMVEGISQKLIDRNRADIRLGGDKSADKAGPDKVGADKPAPASTAAKPAKPAS
jgi:competence protein ComEA